MCPMSSLTTMRGDDGTTGLLFGGRVPKSDARIAAAGEADELNAVLGLARVHVQREDLRAIIGRAQADLVALMGMISAGGQGMARYGEQGFLMLTEEHVGRLTEEAAALEAEFPGGFRGWSTPGADGQAAPAWLELARCVCRRAERAASGVADVPQVVVPWLNRLSDLLWLCARAEERGWTPSQAMEV